MIDLLLHTMQPAMIFISKQCTYDMSKNW